MTSFIGLAFTLGAIMSMVLCHTAKKWFNKDCTFFFLFICCAFADIAIILISGFKFEYDSRVLVYSLISSLFHSLASVSLVIAYKSGNFSLSELVMSYSLLLPILYGIIFLNEKTTIPFYGGVFALLVGIFLISFKKNEKLKDKPKKQFNLKWLISLSLAFIGNGACTIIQTAEQKDLDGLYKNEFMIITLTVSTVIFLILSLIFERNSIKEGAKDALKFGSISGVLNGVFNLLLMYCVNYLNASIVFPLLSGGSLVLTFIIARIFFKEKFTVTQYIGFAACIVSLVLLNL